MLTFYRARELDYIFGIYTKKHFVVSKVLLKAKCKNIYLGAQNVCYLQGVLECKMLILMESVLSASHAKIAGMCILSR